MELWRIRFTSQGAAVRVSSISEDGLRLETDGPDVLGRPFEINVRGIGPFDRQLRDYFLQQAVSIEAPTVRAVDGALSLDYPVTQPLPNGTYSVQCIVAGLRLPRQVQGGPEHGVMTVTIDIQPTKRFSLTVGDIDRWDHEIRDLIKTRQSIADGVPLDAWLHDDAVDPQRRACVVNILAKLRCTPSYDNPLIRSVRRILGVQLERIYVSMDPGLTTSPDGGLLDAEGFKQEGSPVDAAAHARVLRWISDPAHLNPPGPNDLALDSYRQSVTFTSLQVVYASPQFRQTGGPCYADIDIDLGGSLTDVVGFLVHMGELQGDSNITDHLAMHDELLKHDSLVKQFMYYKVE